MSHDLCPLEIACLSSIPAHLLCLLRSEMALCTLCEETNFDDTARVLRCFMCEATSAQQKVVHDHTTLDNPVLINESDFATNTRASYCWSTIAHVPSVRLYKITEDSESSTTR